jgi:hypothetical protein
MPTSLDQWQENLEAHFHALAQTRAGSGFHIFALEHNLGREELNEVSSLLRSRIKAGLPLSPHWLLWVIYATERGYNYAGDEYWQSFDDQTPGWESGDRYKVVPWFRKFQKAYDGVVPSGPWAAHFRIIAWPITHAILPRYLQQQFARALYDLRYRLAGLRTVTPAVIGRLLSGHAHRASTRFEELLQQEDLTGRIVLALLGATPTEGKEPIYSPTLQRIVDDLEKVRSAREWLKEAQRVVHDRFKGIGHGTGPTAQGERFPNDDRLPSDTARLSIRPNLMLRYGGHGTWSLILETPSFRSVAALSTDALSFLRHTRCRLNGAADTKPAGWILGENRKGILKSWPNSGKPLIQFEQSHAAIEHLLESECRLSPGPIWLFRTAADGTAEEIISRVVRPGYSYIVITKGELPEANAWMTPCKVDCNEVRSFRIAIPAEVSAEATAWLNRLGVQVTRTIRVWPAGLPGRNWDGEGRSEWLTTETPCLGIIHDHPVDAYVLCLDNRSETIVKPTTLGQAVFVRIEPLPAGTHLLTVKARRSSSLQAIASSVSAEGYIQLKVREPEPWTPGVASHPGLIVTIDPPDPDLDTFWRNEIDLSVLGPKNHSVTISVTLQDRSGQNLLSEQIGSSMDMPVTSKIWRNAFAHFLNREECAWKYLEASIGTLTIKGDSLGTFSARFEHNLLPLRWVLRPENGKILLRLIDDSGLEKPPTVIDFSMSRPLKGESYATEKALAGMIVAPPGGLFIAMHGEHHDSIAVSTGLTADGFEGLSAKPSFADCRNGSVSLENSLKALELWQNARLAGFLAEFRRQEIKEGLTATIYETICGPEWAKAEAAYLRNPSSRQAINNLQHAVHTRTAFAAVLRRDYTKIDRDLVKALGWYKELATRYGLSMDQTLCKFVLALATRPDGIHRTFGPEVGRLIKKLISEPAILRGARFLALLCENQGRILPTLPSRWA